MAAIVTSKFRISNSLKFISGFSETPSTNMYLFIGRPKAWPDDNSPPTPVDNVQSEFDIWKDMMAVKRVQSSDVRSATIRRNWTSGTVYDYYRPDYSTTTTSYSGATSLATATYFVLTSDYNVYKCISNNKNAASTVMPTGTGNSIITTADGYMWKYMYTVSTGDITKFLTIDFMPVVTNATVSAAAVNGSIPFTRVDVGGTGYTTATVAIVGDGSGATATATLAGGAVTAITMTAVGTGYTYATATITGNGTGAVAVPVISPKGGHGYDAVTELSAFYVILNTRLEYAETGSTFPTANDYRRVGLIKNPYNYGTTTIATTSALSTLSSLTLAAGAGTFVSDELITGATSGAQARVADYNSTTRVLRYYQTSAENFKVFTTSEVISGGTSIASGTISAKGNPSIQPNSGDIVYVEQRRPIARAADQVESISLVVEF